MHSTLLVLILVLFIDVANAVGQYSANRHLLLHRLQATGALYDSSKATYQIRLPYLPTVPPYSTGSTFEQFVAYTAIDSVLRHTSQNALDTWLNIQSSWNDTTRALSKYYYKVVDDNPGQFAQYEQATRLGQINTGEKRFKDSAIVYDTTTTGSYAYSFTSIKPKIRRALRLSWPVDSTRQCFASLIGSSIIVRGNIVGIDTALNMLNGGRSMVMAVTMIVSDTIKGKVLPGFATWTYPRDTTGFGQLTNPPTSNTIRFEYVPEQYPAYSESWSVGMVNGRDTAFTDPTTGRFRMRVGTDVIVFLSFMNPLLDDNYDYFSLGVDTSLSGGALAVVGGMVADPSRVWSGAASLTYSAWLSRVLDIVSRISQ